MLQVARQMQGQGTTRVGQSLRQFPEAFVIWVPRQLPPEAIQIAEEHAFDDRGKGGHERGNYVVERGKIDTRNLTNHAALVVALPERTHSVSRCRNPSYCV